MTAAGPLPAPDLTNPWDIAHWAMLKAARAAPDANPEHLNAYARDYLAEKVKQLAAQRDRFHLALRDAITAHPCPGEWWPPRDGDGNYGEPPQPCALWDGHRGDCAPDGDADSFTAALAARHLGDTTTDAVQQNRESK